MKKRLLIFTQKMNKTDPVLGFFHEWVRRIASDGTKVTVICLEKGLVDLPSEIRVFSLGKEDGLKDFDYVKRFYKYLWILRKDYDSVFIHMNQEYALLGGIPWRIMGKRVMLWRNHPSGGFLTKIAVLFSHRVFCTSKTSFTARFKKTRIMPVGVDIKDEGGSDVGRIEKSILSLGRLSPVKNIHTILEAFGIVRKEVSGLTLTITGDPIPREIDLNYKKSLDEQYLSMGLGESVKWPGGISPDEAKGYYLAHDVFVNATTPGSFDKTIIEAAYFGCITLVCQDIWADTPQAHLSKYLYFKYEDVSDLASKIKTVLSMSNEEKEKIRKDLNQFVRDCHSLEALVFAIREEANK